jgi:uncharacterized protein (DUF1800 family)
MAAHSLGRRLQGSAPASTFLATLLALLLAGCGGGGGSDGTAAAQGSATPTASATSGTAGTSSPAAVVSRQDAFRLLTQATFGPTDTAIAAVQAQGLAPWVDAQLARPSSAAYLARWDADNAYIAARTPGNTANSASVISQFYVHALTSDDQLRHRVAYALSEIFVVSTTDLTGFHARSAASYMDLLNRDAFANYRTLLQDVTLSPAMGQYLNMMHNQKENPATGQVPDQNYAREVMQLFSIGLSQLNPDGTKKLDGSGNAIDTYGPDDIAGMSATLTGWSWGGPDTINARFFGGALAADPNRQAVPMQAYAQFHSTAEKRFLGTVVAAQSVAAPATSLKAALDTLYLHPNVAPFIGRQLIQRLVTSHPSAAYVGRVSAVFNNNGAGVRGDLKAVVRAILLDPEARTNSLAASSDSYGKVREPVLRLTAWLRAFNAHSDSGQALITNTDDPGLALGQSPLRSPTVFNFYRPGYVAAGSLTGARDLTVPELQTTTETSVAGYVNYMTAAVMRGLGMKGLDGKAARPDVNPDLAGELALAAQTGPLVDRVTAKLLGDGVPDAYKAEIRTAVDSIAIPVLKAGGTNQAQVDLARRNRVNAAVLLTLASPEFIVQK